MPQTWQVAYEMSLPCGWHIILIGNRFTKFVNISTHIKILRRQLYITKAITKSN